MSPIQADLPGFPSTAVVTTNFGTRGATEIGVMTAFAAIIISSPEKGETVWANSRRAVRCVMWMRACAICKRLLTKHNLSDSVRCECGWEW